MIVPNLNHIIKCVELMYAGINFGIKKIEPTHHVSDSGNAAFEYKNK